MTEQCAEGGNSCMAADPSLFLLLVVYLFCKSKGKDLPIALVFFDHCQHEGWGCTSKWERGMLILGVGREPHTLWGDPSPPAATAALPGRCCWCRARNFLLSKFSSLFSKCLLSWDNTDWCC